MNYFVDMGGNVQSRAGATRDFDVYINEELTHNITWDAGIRAQPMEGLNLGLSYKMEHYSKVGVNTRNLLGSMDLDIFVEGVAVYMPHQLTLGVAYEPLPDALLLSLDLSWRMWSRYGGPYTKLTASVPSGAPENELFLPEPLDVEFHDTAAVRFGLEYTARIDPVILTPRIGYQYENSPIGRQDGETNMMDSDRHIFSTGLSLGFSREKPILKVFRWDLYFQAQYLPTRTHTKDPDKLLDIDPETDGLQTLNSGFPGISGGGWVLSAGFVMSFVL